MQSPVMHKRSRLLGAKNKKGKVQKKKGAEPLRLTYPVDIVGMPRPSDKAKENM